MKYALRRLVVLLSLVALITSALQATVPVTQAAATDTVYITKTGKKFHAAGCSSLRKTKIAIKRSAATAKGCTPCKNCRP